MSSPNTQLTNTSEFKTENLIFGNPIKGNIPKSPIEFHRIPIQIKNSDGSVGDLVLPTETITSFGVEEEKEMGSEKPKGTYKFPMALWNMNGATDGEKEWTDTFMKVLDGCKIHLNSMKDDEDFPYAVDDKTVTEMINRAIYWGKRDKKTKQLIEPKNLKPYLSPKLIQKFVNGERTMVTQFFDSDGNDIDFKQLIGKRVSATAAVKIEGIFCKDNLFSLQVKLLEAEVTFLNAGVKRLLRPKKVEKQDISEVSIAKNDEDDDDSDSSSDSSSDEDDDDEDENQEKIELSEDEQPEPVKPAPKKNIRGKKK